MKILLIVAESYHVKHKTAIPLGVLSLATYMHKNGHEVQVFDRAVESSSLMKRLNSYEPDIIGVSTHSFKCFSDAIKVSKIAKKKNKPVVWGGPLTSIVPDIVLESGVVDYVVMGEGEITFTELINAITNKSSLREVDGLAFRESGKTVINKEREFADLSRLPVIDFKFVDPEKYLASCVGCRRMLHIYTSKGCTGHCTYCYNPYSSKCIWRPRPVEHYLSEIKYLIENHNIDAINFVDDMLSPKISYIIDFCNKILESGMSFLWTCCLRADCCTKETLQLMYEAGCRWIMFGIESGSEERQKEIRKNLNLNKTKETMHYCKEIGIVTSVSFIVNFPDETEDELEQTVRYIQGLEADLKLPFFFGPVPRSEMYDNLQESGRLTALKSYKDCSKMKTMDLFSKNYSNIPVRELKVVVSCYYLAMFLHKYPEDNQSRFYVKRSVLRVLGFIKSGSLKSAYLIFMAAKEFFEVLYYATMFPKIRKKYKLTNR